MKNRRWARIFEVTPPDNDDRLMSGSWYVAKKANGSNPIDIVPITSCHAPDINGFFSDHFQQQPRNKKEQDAARRSRQIEYDIFLAFIEDLPDTPIAPAFAAPAAVQPKRQVKAKNNAEKKKGSRSKRPTEAPASTVRRRATPDPVVYPKLEPITPEETTKQLLRNLQASTRNATNYTESDTSECRTIKTELPPERTTLWRPDAAAQVPLKISLFAGLEGTAPLDDPEAPSHADDKPRSIRSIVEGLYGPGWQPKGSDTTSTPLLNAEGITTANPAKTQTISVPLTAYFDEDEEEIAAILGDHVVRQSPELPSGATESGPRPFPQSDMANAVENAAAEVVVKMEQLCSPPRPKRGATEAQLPPQVV